MFIHISPNSYSKPTVYHIFIEHGLGMFQTGKDRSQKFEDVLLPMSGSAELYHKRSISHWETKI